MVREAKADVYDGPHGPRPSYVGFKSNEYHWKPNIDYRENPHLYKLLCGGFSGSTAITVTYPTDLIRKRN